MYAIVGLWRWRGNPLRRRSDVLEGWIAVAALALILVLAPPGAVLGTHYAEKALLETVRAERAERTRANAVVVRVLMQRPADTDPESATRQGTQVIARWTARGGTVITTQLTCPLTRPGPGDVCRIWTDREGRAVQPPLSRSAARSQSLVAGAGVFLLVAGTVELSRRTVMWQLRKGRYCSWDAAWDKAGPDRGRTGTPG